MKREDNRRFNDHMKEIAEEILLIKDQLVETWLGPKHQD